MVVSTQLWNDDAERCALRVSALSGLFRDQVRVGRSGLEPPTSALIPAHCCACERQDGLGSPKLSTYAHGYARRTYEGAGQRVSGLTVAEWRGHTPRLAL